MNTTVDYPEFNDFENQLIKRIAADIAARFHLSYQDREDVQQELAVFLWRQKDSYDPQHASGSKYETYIKKCIERKSLEILRSVCPDITVESEPDSPLTFSDKRIGTVTDVNALYRVTTSSAFSRLTPQQKDLFRQLGAGKPIAEIAVEAGVGYPTMHCRVRRLRAVLKKHGFDFSMN